MEEIDEPLKLGILLNLENFIHCFPTSFTSLERKFVHQCCHHLKILAKTIGKGTNKYVICVKDPDILAVDEACSFSLNPSTISQIGHLVNTYPLTHKERCDLLLRTERFGNNVTEDVERNKIVGRINIGISLVPHCEHIAIDENLPIYGFRNDILDMINNSPITIVDGPINSGKSTQVPLYLLEWAKVKKQPIKIIFVQNTKLQVVNSADNLAQLLGEKVGQTIGYQIRLESKVSPTSLLTFCTPWVFLRNLMTQDAELANLTHLFLDDMNERSASMELILMYLRQCCNFNYTSYINLKNNNPTNNINNLNNVKFISPSTCKLVFLCNDDISLTKSELYNYFMDSSTLNATKGNTTSFCNSISVIMTTNDAKKPHIENFYLEDILEIINYSYENEPGVDKTSFDMSYAKQFFETLTAILYQTKPTSTQDYNMQLLKMKQTEFQTLFSALPTNITNNCPEKSSNIIDLQRYLSNEPYMNTLMETIWILDVLTLSLNENKKLDTEINHNRTYETPNTYLGLVVTFFLKSIGSSVLMVRNTRLDINFFMMAAWLGNISVLKDLFDTSMRQTYDKFDCSQNSVPTENKGYVHVNTLLNAFSKYKGWIALDWAFHSPINTSFGTSNLEHPQILNDSFHKINLVDSSNYSAKDNVNSSEVQNYIGSTYNSAAYDLIQTFYELTSLQPFEEAKLYLLQTNQNSPTSPKTMDKLLNFYHSLYDTKTNNNNVTVENAVIYTLKQLLLNICTQYTKEQRMDKNHESILAFNILCIMPLVDDLFTVRKIVKIFLTEYISAHMNNQNENVETLKFKTFMLFRDMHPQDLKPIYHSLLNQHSQSKLVNIIFATDIVENYIPLPNIHSIIDFGLIYQEYYKLDQNASTLKQGWISFQNLANRQNILKTWISLPGHEENISRCYYAFYSKSRYHLICRTDEAIDIHNSNSPIIPQNPSICQYNSYVFGDISNIILPAKMLLNNTNSTLNTSTPYPSGLSLSDFLQKIPCNLTHSNHVRNKISPTTKEEFKKEKSKSEENTYAQYLAKKIRTLIQNLKNIDILDDCGDITECGQHSLDIPLNPVWSRLIIHGLVFKCLDPILTIVSMLVTCLPFNNTGLPYLPVNSILNYLSQKNCFQNEHYANNAPKIDKSDLNNVFGGSNRRNSYEKMGVPADNRLSINGSYQIRIDKGSMSDHLLTIRIFQAWQKARLDGTESSFCHRYNLSSHLLESAYTLRSHLLGQLRASGLVRSSSCTASNVVNNNASSTNNNNNLVLSPNNINFMNSAQNVGSNAISGNGIESFGDIRDCNNNSESWPMVKACLTIALYPNIVKMIPDSSNDDPANKSHFSQSSYVFESSCYNKYLCSPSHTYLPFEVTLKTTADNNKLAFYNPTFFIPKIHEIPAQNSSHAYKVQLNPTSILPNGGAKMDNTKIVHKNGDNHPLWLIFTRFCGPTKYHIPTTPIDDKSLCPNVHRFNLKNNNILSFISQCSLINPLTIILFGGPGKTPKDFIQDIENPDSLQNMASLVLQEESDSESETFYENTAFSQNVRNHKKRASLGDWIELKLDERLLLTQQSDLIRQCLALRQKYQSFILRRLRQPSKAWTHADDVLLRSLVQMLEQEDIQAGITPQPSGIGLRPKPLPIEYYNEVESNDAYHQKQNINYNFVAQDTVYNQRKSSGDINTQLPSQFVKLPPLKKLKFGLIKLEMQNNFTFSNNTNNNNYNNMINAPNLIGKGLTFETADCPTNTNLVMLANSKPPKLGNPDDFCNYPAVEKDILAIIAKNTTNLISHYHQSNVNKSGHNNSGIENENCLNLLLFVYKSKTRIFVGIFHVAIHWKEATLQNLNAESKKPQITSQHDWMIKKIANLIHIQSNCVPEFNTYLTNILTNPASYMDMEPDKAAYLFKYFDNPSKISFLQ